MSWQPDREAAMRPAVIVLAAGDNVAVCRRNIAAGETLDVAGETLVARADLPLGHKVARRFIATGTTIVKYGMPIGSATVDIQTGDWVHLHNMQSNYISTHTRASKVRP
jgi:predicted homoserine dehydrogenase-like protein